MVELRGVAIYCATFGSVKMSIRRTYSDHKDGQLSLKQRQKHKRRSIGIESSEKYGYIPTIKFLRQKELERDRKIKEDGELGQVSVSSPSMGSASSRKVEKSGKKGGWRLSSMLKSGASHSDRLKKLYVGSDSEIKIESPSSAAVPKPSTPVPKKAAAEPSGRTGIHEHFQKKRNGSPFQKTSRPMSANRIASQTRTFKNVNFAFETSLNEVDLNLLSKARASSSEAGGISKSSTPIPVAPPSQVRAPTPPQTKKVPSEVKQPSVAPKNASETKDLSSLLSSRLKMRKTLFNNKSAVIEKQTNNSVTNKLDAPTTDHMERKENKKLDSEMISENSQQNAPDQRAPEQPAQQLQQPQPQQIPQLDLRTASSPQEDSDTSSLSLVGEDEYKAEEQKSEILNVVEKSATDASPELEFNLTKNGSESREEAGKLVELSDSSSDSSSESTSTDNASGHEVDDFQLLNSIRTRMVGPKVNKWKKLDKEKLTELMDYLVVNHTPLSARPTVSCSNDICNARNYESVEVHHLQKLPQRLKFIDLEAITTSSTEKTSRTNNRVEKPRKNQPFNNGAVQKRRTRASQLNSEVSKRTIPLEEQPLNDIELAEENVNETLKSVDATSGTENNVEIHQVEESLAGPTREENPQLNPDGISEPKVNVSTVLQSELPLTSDDSKIDTRISGTDDAQAFSHEMVHENEFSSKLSRFDAAKCTDIEEMRREYIKLQISMNDNGEKLAEANIVNTDKTLVIEKLTQEIMQSEMKYASLVGVNHQLREKIKAMNSLQLKLMHELELAVAEPNLSEEQSNRSNDLDNGSSNADSSLQHKRSNMFENTTKTTSTSTTTSEPPSEDSINELLSLTLLTHKASSKFTSCDLPETVGAEFRNLNHKLALVSFFLARMRNSNDNTNDKSQLMIENYNELTNASSPHCANFIQYAGNIQPIVHTQIPENNRDVNMKSSDKTSSTVPTEESVVEEEEAYNWRAENDKAKEKIKQLEDRIESMTKELEVEAKKGIYYKQLEDYVSPVVNYCAEKNITIKILMEKLSWINKMEMAIVRLSKERDFYLKRVKDLETSSVDPPPSHLVQENTRLKEAILRLHNERKKLLEVINKEKQDRKQSQKQSQKQDQKQGQKQVLSQNIKQGENQSENQHQNPLKIVYVDKVDYGKQNRKKNRNKNKNKSKMSGDDNKEENSSNVSNIQQ